MRKQCEACGSEFDAKRSNHRFCKATCRVRGSRAPKIKAVPEPEPDEGAGADVVVPFEGALVRVTRAQLDKAGRLDTPLGVMTLVLAARLDNPLNLADTGSSFAAVSKEYRATLAEAMRDAETERDELDHILQSATVTLLSGGAR